MPGVYSDVADKISAVMRENRCNFNTAFLAVIQNYKNLDWAITRREVGRLLGSRKKSKSLVPRVVKISQQINLMFGRPREEILADSARQEAELIAGIPEHDL